MMKADAARLCGVRYGRDDGKDGDRWGRTKGKLGFHGGKVALERPACGPATAARSRCRVGSGDTLISIRFIAHPPSQSSAIVVVLPRCSAAQGIRLRLARRGVFGCP